MSGFMTGRQSQCSESEPGALIQISKDGTACIVRPSKRIAFRGALKWSRD
jgi:hypothetical protein